MEYVDGVHLDTYCDAHKLGVAIACNCFYACATLLPTLTAMIWSQTDYGILNDAVLTTGSYWGNYIANKSAFRSRLPPGMHSA